MFTVNCRTVGLVCSEGINYYWKKIQLLVLCRIFSPQRLLNGFICLFLFITLRSKISGWLTNNQPTKPNQPAV
jgi:hypothetical protein